MNNKIFIMSFYDSIEIGTRLKESGIKHSWLKRDRLLIPNDEDVSKVVGILNDLDLEWDFV